MMDEPVHSYQQNTLTGFNLFLAWDNISLLIYVPVFLCKVRFKGPLTYLKSADQRYTPTRPLQEDSDASWAMLVDG